MALLFSCSNNLRKRKVTDQVTTTTLEILFDNLDESEEITDSDLDSNTIPDSSDTKKSENRDNAGKDKKNEDGTPPSAPPVEGDPVPVKPNEDPDKKKKDPAKNDPAKKTDPKSDPQSTTTTTTTTTTTSTLTEKKLPPEPSVPSTLPDPEPTVASEGFQCFMKDHDGVMIMTSGYISEIEKKDNSSLECALIDGEIKTEENDGFSLLMNEPNFSLEVTEVNKNGTNMKYLEISGDYKNKDNKSTSIQFIISVEDLRNLNYSSDINNNQVSAQGGLIYFIKKSDGVYQETQSAYRDNNAQCFFAEDFVFGDLYDYLIKE